MPPFLALLLTLLFSATLLVRDARRQPRPPSLALWLPVIWVFFAGSKFPSQWLQVLGVLGGQPSALEEGSPIDAAFFLVLIVAGATVLMRRQFSLRQLCGSNVWLTLFFGYCFLAITWSDFPFVAFKRWIKVLGHPIMVLVILSDARPTEALKTVFKRAAFLMLPLSVTFIKYFPELGRYFDPWTGEGGNGGIHHNKNELGYTCMLLGLFLLWHVLSSRNIPDRSNRRAELFTGALLLGLVTWLLWVANSATALVCTAAGAGAMAIVGSRLVSPRFIGVQVILAVVLLVALEVVFGVYRPALELLGRAPTLTDRTEVWSDVLATPINPIIGAGFESFWLGSRLERLWAKWWWKPNQAHNGYIETYLNLGLLGVSLLVGVIWATYRKARAELLRERDYGRLRFAFLVSILLYNYTEATFKGVHLVWTVFHLIAIDYTVGAVESRPGAGRASSLGGEAAVSRPPETVLQRMPAAASVAGRGRSVALQFRPPPPNKP